MKILHIITSLGCGGAEMLLVNFINKYKLLFPEHKHFILTLGDDTQLLDSVESSIEEYTCLYAEKWTSTISNGLQIRRYIKKNNIDIIHAHLAQPIIMSRVFKPRKTPSVYSYHNMEYCPDASNFSWKLPLLDQITYPKNSYSIFVSKQVEKCVLRYVKKTYAHAVVNNFAGDNFRDCYAFRADNILRLVSVGGLKKVKNHIYLLKALSKLNVKNVQLDIYGEGSYRSRLEDIIKENKLKVILKGSRPINSDLLSKYDAFILPSLSEGMPVSLIEAMVTGMPSLLSDLPQLREIAKGSAFYFDPNNEDELIGIIRQIISKKTILIKKSLIAKELGKQYTVENYIDKVDKIYKDLIFTGQISGKKDN